MAPRAAASSEYAPTDWSASQATGAPDTTSYGDHPTAWAPRQSDGGAEWIELTYERALRPTAIDIWETSGSGFVQQVEAWDDGDGRRVTLWQGADPSASEQIVSSAPLTAAGFATKRIRVTIDTGVPDWNEIDAVSLSGVAP